MIALILASDDGERGAGDRPKWVGERSQNASHPRLLIVEDDFVVALELEQRLQDAGFTIVGTAATAEEAIELAAAEKPDLAIMDIRLAGPRDGIDAAKTLYSAFGVRSIFATAHSDPTFKSRGQEAYPVGWLQKPYRIGELIGLIKQVSSKPN